MSISPSVKTICRIDPSTGMIDKKSMTKANHRALKQYMQKKAPSATVDENLSFRQYCRLFDALKFKSGCCPGGRDECNKNQKGPCCQAITDSGSRCTRLRRSSAMSTWRVSRRASPFSKKIPKAALWVSHGCWRGCIKKMP